jgi:hypothetical protein
MSKRELVARELEQLPEADLDRLMAFMLSLRNERTDTRETLIAAESALAKDWLSTEEDAAWADL